RLLPLIAASSTLGSLAAAAAAGLLPIRAGLGVLFFGAALLALVAVGPLAGLAREDGRQGRAHEHRPGLVAALRHTALDAREVPAVRIVVLVGLGGAVITNFVDFAFRSALKESFDRE